MVVLVILGAIIALVGSIWMLVEQFKTGILWGLACLFIPIVSLIWLIMHWEDGAKPFLVAVGGWALVLVGTMLSSGQM